MTITKIVKVSGVLMETSYEFKEKLAKNVVLHILENIEASLQGEGLMYVCWEDFFYTDNKEELIEYVLNNTAIR